MKGFFWWCLTLIHKQRHTMVCMLFLSGFGSEIRRIPMPINNKEWGIHLSTESSEAISLPPKLYLTKANVSPNSKKIGFSQNLFRSETILVDNSVNIDVTGTRVGVRSTESFILYYGFWLSFF